MSLPPPWGLVLAAAAVVAALTTLAAAARWVHRRMKRMTDLADDLLGEPARAGVPERPGVMSRLETLERRTRELVPNGGSSLKDVVSATAREVEAVKERLALVEAAVSPRRRAR